MQTDRELIEAAAKAAGIELFYRGTGAAAYERSRGLAIASGGWWNPLADDGDALRLAVKLDMIVCVGRVEFGDFDTWEDCIDMPESEVRKDPFAATRRAVTIAAAAMAQISPLD